MDDGTMTKGGLKSQPTSEDLMLQMVKEQGYVPQGCYLDGQLVFALQTTSVDPCFGCQGDRLICGGRTKE